MGYLANFIVYTLAMVGVMTAALFVFKKTSQGGVKNSGKFLKVVDTLNIGPRKTLYIVSAGEEKFLIAGDVDRTSLISKLNPRQNNGDVPKDIPSINMDRMPLGIKNTQNAQNTPYSSVMKSLAEKMKNQ